MTRAIAIISCLFAALFLALGSEEGGEIPDYGYETDSGAECVMSQPSVLKSKPKSKGLANYRIHRSNFSQGHCLCAGCVKSAAPASVGPAVRALTGAGDVSLRVTPRPARIRYCIFRE